MTRFVGDGEIGSAVRRISNTLEPRANFGDDLFVTKRAPFCLGCGKVCRAQSLLCPYNPRHKECLLRGIASPPGARVPCLEESEGACGALPLQVERSERDTNGESSDPRRLTSDNLIESRERF